MINGVNGSRVDDPSCTKRVASCPSTAAASSVIPAVPAQLSRAAEQRCTLSGFAQKFIVHETASWSGMSGTVQFITSNHTSNQECTRG